MSVIIGVDPPKAAHTAIAIDRGEEELARKKVRAGGRQVDQLMAWAEPFETRTWAIESAGGLGYLLAQQLVAAGEVVVDVPTVASRARLLATRPVEQERPQRRPVRRGGGTAPGACDWWRSLGTTRCCACWPSATPISQAISGPARVSYARVVGRDRPGRDRQGDQRP